MTTAHGVLPAGWTEARLGDVAEFTRKPGGLDLSGEVPFVPMALISQDGGEITTFETRDHPKSGTYFEEGDLLLARITPCFENGKQGIARDVPGGWGLATTEVYPLRSDALSTNFLARLFQLPPVHQRLVRSMEGATGRMRVPKEALEDLVIPVPPRSVQDRIVDVIDAHYSRIDDGERSVRQAQRLAALLRDQIRDGCARPERHTIRPLSDCLAEPLMNGRSVPTAEEGFPVLRLTALQRGFIELTEAKVGAWTESDAQPYLVHAGDFLVARGNGSLKLVGRGGLVAEDPPPLAFPDTLIRMRVNRDILCNEYLQVIWDSRVVRQQIEGQARTTAGIYKINQKILRELRLPVPSVDEQIATVRQARRRLRSIDELEASLVKDAEFAAQLRRSVLGQAFAGDLISQANAAASG